MLRPNYVHVYLASSQLVSVYLQYNCLAYTHTQTVSQSHMHILLAVQITISKITFCPLPSHRHFAFHLPGHISGFRVAYVYVFVVSARDMCVFVFYQVHDIGWNLFFLSVLTSWRIYLLPAIS